MSARNYISAFVGLALMACVSGTRHEVGLIDASGVPMASEACTTDNLFAMTANRYVIEDKYTGDVLESGVLPPFTWRASLVVLDDQRVKRLSQDMFMTGCAAGQYLSCGGECLSFGEQVGNGPARDANVSSLTGFTPTLIAHEKGKVVPGDLGESVTNFCAWHLEKVGGSLNGVAMNDQMNAPNGCEQDIGGRPNGRCHVVVDLAAGTSEPMALRANFTKPLCSNGDSCGPGAPCAVGSCVYRVVATTPAWYDWCND